MRFICHWSRFALYQHIHRLYFRRLGPDRRVYAFFENNVPNEPLVFVHVALVPSISNSVQAILNEPERLEKNIDTSKFKCAICYSITTQQGLGGINLGNYLIKQVVKDLQRQYPFLETFATLSPMPGFRKWVLNNVNTDSKIQAELKSVGDWNTVSGHTTTSNSHSCLHDNI